MFPTAIAGSLPKPAWLAETQKLWPQWKAEGAALIEAKSDATLLWVKTQEDLGLDVIGENLTEINVTSPTCFREITDQTGFDVAAMFIDALEACQHIFDQRSRCFVR